jgi:phosphatidate cytidylyltransferase
MKTFATRTLTAIVFAAVMLAGILWNRYSFCLLFGAITCGALYEYRQMLMNIDAAYTNISKGHLIFLWIAAVAILLICTGEHFQWLMWSTNVWGMDLLIFSLIMIPLSDVFMNKFRFKNMGYSLAGLLYIPFSFGLLINLRLEKPFHDFSSLIPLGLIVCIWINDTMAYIVGSLIGKTKFSPSISPKKTWEGTLGGIILTIIVAGIFGYFTNYYPAIDWIIIAALAGVIGTIGDLLESKLKRMAGIKDSGHIMPGHGGFLDRFDSLLLATPFVWWYATFWMH